MEQSKPSTTSTVDLELLSPLIIGSKYDGSPSDWQGRVDDIRIRKGTGVSTAPDQAS